MKIKIDTVPRVSFTAFDFETATYYPGSACALGIVVVENGYVSETRSWFINPPVDTFNPEFIRLHGITPKRVENEPRFCDIWPDLKPYLIATPLVAHNAKFDLNVLTATCRHFGLKIDTLNYACSLDLARKAWPSLTSHKLNSIASYLSLSLNHHDAASDALVCAQLTLAACRHLRYLTNKDLPVCQYIQPPSRQSAPSWEDQAQEIRKARAQYVRVNKIDVVTRSGNINGYLVSEASCACPDFQERHKPCKHIYRLKQELEQLTLK